MRAIKHLTTRFHHAIKDKKPLYLNKNDVNALNEMIDFYNGQRKDTGLEDSLILLFIMQYWRAQNIDNQKYEGAILKLDDIKLVFEKMCALINSKEMILEEITCELQAHQRMNGVTTLIDKESVSNLLNESINVVKEMKPLNNLRKIRNEYRKIVD